MAGPVVRAVNQLIIMGPFKAIINEATIIRINREMTGFSGYAEWGKKKRERDKIVVSFAALQFWPGA